MRNLFGGLALTLVVVGTASPAAAQQRRGATTQRPSAPAAKHEFGVDAGLAYYKPDGGDGGIRIGTPLDVRVGLVSAGRLMWEPRLIFEFDSEIAGGDAGYVIQPGVNALYSMSPTGHRQGMYLTGGMGLNLVDAGAAGGVGFSLNGAVGWRLPYGTGAGRIELGLKYDTEIQDSGATVVPSTFSIGGRFGISLWH